jgi:mono/diheme cytochrome c family protein
VRVRGNVQRENLAWSLTMPICVVIWVLVASGPISADDTEGDRLFQQVVAPIFEQRCVRCHNDADKKGGLSLQTREALLAGGESGSVVQPGAPDSSYLIELVTAKGDTPAEMPKEGAALDAEQLKALRRWIALGAPWPQRRLHAAHLTDDNWWAFQPLKCPPLPELTAEEWQWVRTPIDAFVAVELRRHGLQPSPEADRRTLIRRLYFDLLGLPPPAEEVQAFLQDTDPCAYERVVDRLLASPRYGERWARHWLDVVHYADTHGYDKDQPRPNAWPYRDYVIRALNSDKPYGRFIREQVAGDVLYPGTHDGIVALGFLAAGPWDFISHVEVPEEKIDGRLARSLDRDDMVRTVLETFNSVTIGCARCHDHKFDPFTQHDYYRLQAVFAAVDRADRPYDLDPQIAQERRRLLDAAQALQEEAKHLSQQAHNHVQGEIVELDRHIQQLLPTVLESAPAEYGYHSAIEQRPDVEKWVQVDLQQTVTIQEIVLQPCFDSFNNIGAGFGFPVRYHVQVCDDADFQHEVKTVCDYSDRDIASPGLAPQRLDGRGIRGRYVRVTATRLAPRKNDFIFALAELMVIDEQGRNVSVGCPVQAKDSIEAPARWSARNLTDGKHPGSQAPDEMWRELMQAYTRRQTVLDNAFTPAERARYEQLQQQLAEVQRRLEALPEQGWVYAAATHFKEYGNFRPTQGRCRPIFLLQRGNIRQPGEEVAPGVPAALAYVADTFSGIDISDEAQRRAALAEWLAQPAHPLTWRSIANRIWHYHFGRGLVDTPNDFGRRGSTPTHPELLDWLAVRLRDGEQSIKDLHRLICTSAVYRQSSDYRAEAAQIDAENRWLWRMNRRRLEAEALRDALWYVAGQLDESMYGPGYRDFVIDKPEHSPHYEYHLHDPADPRVRRRAIYRFIVRSQPQPFLTIWDCADPSMQVDRRNETVTPQQSLSLWNDPLVLVACRHFAQRVQSVSDDVQQQLRAAFWWALARPPTAEEVELFLPFVQQFGWENTCRVIFNSSEFLYYD